MNQNFLFSNETFEPCLNLAHPSWTEEQFRIYGSSNGLLCISDQYMDLNGPISIWNPSIGKYRTLPNVDTRLAFDEPDQNTLSFGFHPELNDYKVVRIMLHLLEEESLCEVDVYTLSTNAWKRIGLTPPCLNSIQDMSLGSPFLNGTACWIVGKQYSGEIIVMFDTGSEEFQEIMVPDIISSKGGLCVKLWKDSICLISNYFEGPGQIDLWIIEEQNLKKLYTISPPAEGVIYGVLSFSIDDEVILNNRDVNGRCYMALYNLESKLVNQSGIRLAADSYAGSYTESLVLLSD